VRKRETETEIVREGGEGKRGEKMGEGEKWERKKDREREICRYKDGLIKRDIGRQREKDICSNP